MTRKTHKQNFATRPDPGQSRKFVYVYVFFSVPDEWCARSAELGRESQKMKARPCSAFDGVQKKRVQHREGIEVHYHLSHVWGADAVAHHSL